jgi:hypothetical protein
MWKYLIEVDISDQRIQELKSEGWVMVSVLMCMKGHKDYYFKQWIN